MADDSVELSPVPSGRARPRLDLRPTLVLLPMIVAACAPDGAADTGCPTCDSEAPAPDDSAASASPVDADGDGYFDDVDCDDADGAVNPGAVEQCNELDDDCDGGIDEPGSEAEPEWFTDGDGDGYGADSLGTACEAPVGGAASSGDCDDANPTAHPGAVELCNGIDDACDGPGEESPTTRDDTVTVDDLAEVCAGQCALTVSASIVLQGAIGASDLRLLSCVVGVESSVEIFDAGDLETLDGLERLESIGYSLRISGVDSLRSMDALGSLGSVGGIQLGEARLLRSIEPLQGVSSLRDSLELDDLTALDSLHGLDALQRVGGDVRLVGLTRLTSLAGLDGLEEVGGSLRLEDDVELRSLDGLGALETVGDQLMLLRNGSITTLEGAPALTSIGGLHVNGEDGLVSLSGLSGLRTLAGPLYVALTPLASLDLSPAVTEIEGDLTLVCEDTVLDLSGLEAVELIGGSVYLDALDSIVSLRGLDNVARIGGHLAVGCGTLKDGGGCTGNGALESFDGLGALTGIDGSLWVVANVALADLAGASALERVGGDVVVSGNDALLDATVSSFLADVTVDGGTYVSGNGG